MDVPSSYTAVDRPWTHLRDLYLRPACCFRGDRAAADLAEFDELISQYDRVTAEASLDPIDCPLDRDVTWPYSPDLAALVFARMEKSIVALGKQPPPRFYELMLRLALYLALYE